jgi:hypothetical protein
MIEIEAVGATEKTWVRRFGLDLRLDRAGVDAVGAFPALDRHCFVLDLGDLGEPLPQLLVDLLCRDALEGDFLRLQVGVEAHDAARPTDRSRSAA